MFTSGQNFPDRIASGQGLECCFSIENMLSVRNLGGICGICNKKASNPYKVTPESSCPLIPWWDGWLSLKCKLTDSKDIASFGFFHLGPDSVPGAARQLHALFLEE